MKTKANTSEEHLKIIAEMIEQAQGNFSQQSFYYLLWGTVAILCNLGHFILLKLNYPYPYLVWLLTIPAWTIVFIYISRHRNQKTVVTTFDKINMWLWLSLGMSIFILIMFGSYINFKINPIILFLAATPTFVSGVILKFKPLLVGGVVFWLSAIASYLMDYPSQFLISAFAIAVGFLIPGILIKRMFV
ncbi:hypothetical protein BH23BAC1_BH23BAC1_05420 [soil metagenome]